MPLPRGHQTPHLINPQVSKLCYHPLLMGNRLLSSHYRCCRLSPFDCARAPLRNRPSLSMLNTFIALVSRTTAECKQQVGSGKGPVPKQPHRWPDTQDTCVTTADLTATIIIIMTRPILTWIECLSYTGHYAKLHALTHSPTSL